MQEVVSVQNCVNISINSADADSICVYNQRLFFCVQERLLLSILPKHIADEMLQDMKKEASTERDAAVQHHVHVSARERQVSVLRLPAVFQ